MRHMYNTSRRVPVTFFGLPEELFQQITLDINEKDKIVTLVYVKVREEHMGTFRRLLAALEASEYKVRIFCPVRRTRAIISRLGYGPVDAENWEKGVEATFESIQYGSKIDVYTQTAEAVYEY